MDLLNTLTVSFFGHRDFSEHDKVEPLLLNMLKDIVSKNEYVEFLVGNNGEFDNFVSSVIRNVKNNYIGSNSDHILCLAYDVKKVEDMRLYANNYDDYRFYCDRNVHFKAALTRRNEDMILESHLVIFYVTKKSGGAYKALEFAKKNFVNTVNLADLTE